MSDQQPFVRDDGRRFLDCLNALPGPRSHPMTAAATRAMMGASCHVADAPVGTLALIRDRSAPGPAGPIPPRLDDARAGRDR